MIEETWLRLERRLVADGHGTVTILNMRQAYVGALYAASAALIADGASSRDISEAAFRIESRHDTRAA